MNKLLQRQIEKHLGSLDAVPAPYQPLFAAISDAYDGFDADRKLIERSLDISSQELTEINERLRGEIAEHKGADNELRHSISLLTATLESTADGILVDDRCGHIKDFNQTFATMWRVPEWILASREAEPLLSFLLEHLEHPEKTVANVQGFDSDPMAETNVVIHLKDGRIFERYSKPQVLDGRIVGRVWSFRDVTEQVRLVQELEGANQRLAKVNKELQDFAYVVSHDLKAPLRGIKTLAGWIASDCADKLDAEAKEQLVLLLSRVDRMHDLIDGILQYSRIGRLTEEKTRVDLNELVPQVVDLLAPPDSIQITVCDRLPVVECERTRMTQVFQNLIGNAIKYMDKPQGRITVGCTEDDGWWTFRIADNGPGIEEKHFDRVFQLFQTLSPKDDGESTGIGLTLVKKIVELNGGRIWVESQLGEGSTFLFTLPQTIQGDVRNERLQTCPAG
ncbi:MAG TPA: ATP-binding protein [Sedimentisphaerales bacterium]|jgi:signal transduction histidine kinase|nr:ATP-binding protein [Sedimentisphaerales bacterium]HNU30053.1 ATP-binding protein [Sedimentisphaerales bacterium]